MKRGRLRPKARALARPEEGAQQGPHRSMAADRRTVGMDELEGFGRIGARVRDVLENEHARIEAQQTANTGRGVEVEDLARIPCDDAVVQLVRSSDQARDP